MTTEVDSARRIAERSVEILGKPEEELLFAGITREFAWLKFGELIWARTEDFRAAVFWVTAGAEPVHLNGNDGLPELAKLLLVHTGPLPERIAPVQLAAAIRKLTVEPRGIVACREFLAAERPHLEDWLRADRAPDRELFARHCEDPQLSATSDERWSLGFDYFNPAGGVEHWQVVGDRARIESARKSVALKAGTFAWPMM